ncbi:MarR family transcriptional regulator [Bosea sp. 62]|uniref:MarR family winged helix-turn-helix transcriptional regulator n=1 Tax=unclassified Bosea (in: a-proteobacteria) TaxID=2653178 RepID=UPI001256E9D8|nr:MULTISPECIES: MarR family winged helix-turn-helix transcriptional regulator [unclassified Bosea (in: a-proteobacteria)]CAD5253071.1 MarR family transcriptional regulator [Bosea sp. 46]CAD5257751.1 MarR family transcriptional regulator [Bosea sp. 21B]CAD5283163.1 MarR family transcriptional regulator [Bosea sp. 7B]VVT52162.1 MarR family transcriptional regulator [Bosea sp. EC-HK365B]VXB37752.1 MarR family transcriptional regulator [Bosea sp. 29B]
MTAFDTSSEPLPQRLREGLERLASVLKADQWSAANAVSLNPTQAHVLSFLAGRGKAGLRVRAIAEHLGVTQPTATDSIAALERKGLVTKGPDASDARAVAVRVTEAGRDAVKAIGLSTTATNTALAGLSAAEQADLLLLVVKLIRSLQLAGALPEQRACVTCRHFRPKAHPGTDMPHHCAFVNAAFGTRHLRLDCGEHETAEPSAQAATWRDFTASAPLQTNR